jgi:hypothetical protein
MRRLYVYEFADSTPPIVRDLDTDEDILVTGRLSIRRDGGTRLLPTAEGTIICPAPRKRERGAQPSIGGQMCELRWDVSRSSPTQIPIPDESPS